jgi:anti-sigma-K factor RskA
MTDRPDIDALASEYVLGTLDAGERAAFAARRAREPALAAAIEAWERRLGPLAGMVPPVLPPDDLLAKIERRLTVGALKTDPNVVAIADLRRRLNRTRVFAGAVSALAASVMVMAVAREWARAVTPQTYVAVFQKDDASPAFLMSVDLNSRMLSVRRVAADVPAGKTYQLWIASDKLGVGPQSLGLVEDQNTDVRRALSGIDPAIVQTALFGVSLEPAGGSPTGKPTGPVFHAKLIPSQP